MRKVISEETSNTVRKYLQAVIDTGTGKKAKIEGYAIGGKTGTAQQAIRANEQYTVTFVGFLPVDNPEIIAIAILDRPAGYTEGSTSAAPMLKGLLENIIKYLGIPKTEAVDENSEAAANTIVLDDLTQYSTNDAIMYLSMKGLNYQVVGEGSVVTSSVPHAGTEVAEDSTVIVYVTKGPNDDNMTQTPNVMGRTYDEAVGALMEAGLSPVVNGDENGVVVSQSPQKGEYVNNGSEVTITLEVTDNGIEEGTSAQTSGSTGTSTGDTSSGQQTTSQSSSSSSTPKVVTTTKKSGVVQ